MYPGTIMCILPETTLLGKSVRFISFYMQSSLITVTWFLQHQLCLLPHLFDSGFSVVPAAYSSLSWWVIWTMFPMLNKVSFQLLCRIVAAGRNVTAMRRSKASSGEMLQQWFDIVQSSRPIICPFSWALFLPRHFYDWGPQKINFKLCLLDIYVCVERMRAL
jgi:hypothetical protein